MRCCLMMLLPLLMLAACGKDPAQSMKECSFEVQKMYPEAEISPYASMPGAVKQALQSCMEAKGFTRDASASQCSMLNVEAQAACYK